MIYSCLEKCGFSNLSRKHISYLSSPKKTAKIAATSIFWDDQNDNIWEQSVNAAKRSKGIRINLRIGYAKMVQFDLVELVQRSFAL